MHRPLSLPGFFKTILLVPAPSVIFTKLYFKIKFISHLQFTYLCQSDNYIHQHIPSYFSVIVHRKEQYGCKTIDL